MTYLYDNRTLNATRIMNTTDLPNFTTTNETYFVYHPPASDIIMVAIYVAVMVFGLIGNGLAISVVLYNPSMKTASNIFILNLALSDFLFLLSLPLTVTFTLERQWIFGPVLCKIHLGLFGINQFSGVYTLLLMSIDRYVAVCQNSLQKYRTVRNSVLACSMAWGFAIALIFPILLYARNDDTQCFVNWGGGVEQSVASAQTFTIYSSSLGFFIPILGICVFYALIIIRLKAHKAPTASTIDSNRKRTRRVTVLVLSIISAYVTCWLPYWSVQIYILAQGPRLAYSRTLYAIYQVATALYNINSTLNPILYGFLSESFRAGIIGMLTCNPISGRQGTRPRHPEKIHSVRKSLQSSGNKSDKAAVSVHLDSDGTAAECLLGNGDKKYGTDTEM